MIRIKNGGVELGILESLPESELTPLDMQRKSYLESLPKNQHIYLDKHGWAISEDQYIKDLTNRFKNAKLDIAIQMEKNGPP